MTWLKVKGNLYIFVLKEFLDIIEKVQDIKLSVVKFCYLKKITRLY